MQGQPHFNAGVVWFNLNKWRKDDNDAEVKRLCFENNKRKFWTVFGSQPPLTILFGGTKFLHLPEAWLQNDLGWKPKQGYCATLGYPFRLFVRTRSLY